MIVGGIIQARVGSTRLPSKVLAPICGRSMLEHVVRRLQATQKLDVVCVATTEHSQDDEVAEIGKRLGAQVFRGSEEDVLLRYVEAGRMIKADLVVRVCADCPLFDPSLLDEMLEARESLVRKSGAIDYYSNNLKRTYPLGLNAEIVPLEILERVAAETSDPPAREHVTFHILQNPEAYRLGHHIQEGGLDQSKLRWTVDTAEDLDFARQVYNALYQKNPLFDRHAVLALLEEQPKLLEINQHIEQKKL